MDEMIALLGDHSPCLLFEQVFLERLPEDIRMQLVDSKIDDFCQLAKHADTLWSSWDTECNTNDVQHRQKAARQTDKTYGSRSLSRQPAVLLYHHTFGEAAQQCRQPCAWSGNEKAGRQQWPRRPAVTMASFSSVTLSLSDSFSSTLGQRSVFYPLLDWTHARGNNGSSIRTYGTRTLPLHFASNTYQ